MFNYISFQQLQQTCMTQNQKPSQVKDTIVALQKQTKMFTAPLQYQKRKKTDVFCTYFGVIFFILTIGLSIGLKNHQNFTKLKKPSDSTGKICGVDYPQYSFLYITNLPEISQRVCVQACPKISDEALKCKPTPTIGCDFSQTVKFTDTRPLSDHNGNICIPTQTRVFKEFMLKSKLESRVSLLNTIILITYGITIGLSVILVVLLNIFPRTTMQSVQYLSLASQIALGIIIYLKKTDQTAVKGLILIFLFVSFVITLSQILIYKQQLKLNRVFMAESSKFLNDKKALSLYILVFQIILGGFFMLLLQMYNGLTSNGKISFDAQSSLYHKFDMQTYVFSMILLLIFGIWGLSIIQELSNFFVSSHTINWYLKIPNDCDSVTNTLKLLFSKHLGSIIGGAFVNGFFFVIQTVLDLIRSCRNSKIKSNQCFFNAIDLARSDTISFIILTGNPYCNSSKYCEYLWSQSMITDQTQSSIRIFKLAAHVFIASVGSIVGIFLRDQLDPYLVAFTLIIGLFISTFFIQFNAISSETLQLIYIMQEEFHKRSEGRIKLITNVLNKADQIRFLSEATTIFSNHDVAIQLRDIRKHYWGFEVDQNGIVSQINKNDGKDEEKMKTQANRKSNKK